jgi:hypothetical protein
MIAKRDSSLDSNLRQVKAPFSFPNKRRLEGAKSREYGWRSTGRIRNFSKHWIDSWARCGVALSMCNIRCRGEFERSNGIPLTIVGMMSLQKCSGEFGSWQKCGNHRESEWCPWRDLIWTADQCIISHDCVEHYNFPKFEPPRPPNPECQSTRRYATFSNMPHHRTMSFLAKYH